MDGGKNFSLLWSLCQLRLSWWGSVVEAVHPFPFSIWVNFASIFTSVKLKKIIINWTGYRNSNFDFTLHHLANKSAAIVLPFPELGVVAEIKYLTKNTALLFQGNRKMTSKGWSEGFGSYFYCGCLFLWVLLFQVGYLCWSCHFVSSLYYFIDYLKKEIL